MGRTKKVITEDQEFDYDSEPTWMDLDETKLSVEDLFDDEDSFYDDGYDSWGT